ncbi:hypothetical protein [Yoonia litorea]|uniref:DUF2157 domain-containing protein n=1 Tax=Yoonia litorea TaxID=1123755 RepID=A0A1I6L4L4_9RHOB|nr:hypothetical protein [Yoonia litorea]SFR98190.1 hypothetical protein SAMN05444714_0153 [Yoonia litorea]
MYYVADTQRLTADGIITESQAAEIKARARSAMIALCVNVLLIGGIIAATLGLVLFLRTPMAVALCGGLFLVSGLTILSFTDSVYRMLGNASALIGAGMLIAGSGFEIANQMRETSGPWLLLLGAGISAIFFWHFVAGHAQLRFAYGAALLMGMVMHIVGLYLAADQFELSGWPMPIVNLYATLLLIGLGLLLDQRFLTALSIVPFAQMLDTGTYYFHAAYVFYSPEPTLSILQMAVLIVLCLWWMNGSAALVRRQAGVLMVMAFLVANLCALVGSLWGDVVGSHIWGPRADRSAFEGDWAAYRQAVEAFEARALVIGEGAFAIGWALALGAIIAFAAFKNQRGLFNAAMTFAGIHAYTQMFESFYDQPLAYVVGGLAAIPLAFGLWRLNNAWFSPIEPGGT